MIDLSLFYLCYKKIIEAVMYNRFVKFLNNKYSFYKYQFGFREGHNPKLALSEFVITLQQTETSLWYYQSKHSNKDIVPLWDQWQCLQLGEKLLDWQKAICKTGYTWV